MGRQAHVMVGGLRAVRAVFRAAAGLDGQESGELHLVGIEVPAVRLVGAEQQVVEGQFVERQDLGGGPGGGRTPGRRGSPALGHGHGMLNGLNGACHDTPLRPLRPSAEN